MPGVDPQTVTTGGTSSSANGPALPAGDEFFDTSRLSVDLKSRAIRGGAITVAGQIATRGLQLGATCVLARLLTPDDYGLVAMVMVVTGFVLMFKDMGLSIATVQRAEINHRQISTLFWVNVAISIVLVVVTIGIAPAIAWFYGRPALTWITIALAGGFLFGGLTVQHQALLRRQMRFGALVTIDLAAVVASVPTGIVLAWLGWGYWALVVMSLVTALVTCVSTWMLMPWLPGRPVRHSGVRSMLTFGGNLTGYSVLNYFARHLDKVLIGRFVGAGQLGLYSRAYTLLLLPLQQIIRPINNVAVPTLSRLQDDPERYRRYYCTSLNLIAFLTMPLVAAMAALSEEIVAIVLGDQWLEAARIFKVLAMAALVQPIGSTVGWIYVSLGRADRMLRWGMIATPLIILSFALGLPWGAFGVATSYALCTVVVIFVPSLLYAYRYSPIHILDMVHAVRRPVLLSLIAYAAMELTRYHVPFQHPLAILGVSGGVGLLVVVVGTLTWPAARAEAASLIALVKTLRK